ncbi:MAG: type 1 glutamine amidotransferase [Patescibacteria group bacterium]
MNNQKKVLIAINITREQPATILEVLQKRDWQATIVNLEQGEAFPSPKDFDALIVMGGPPSADDTAQQTAWMPDEIAKLQEALQANIPYLGVCLGMQTLVKAAGGVIAKSPRKEVGFRESYGEPLGKFYSMQMTDEGKNDPFFKGLDGDLPVFHLHGETVELPDTMNPKASLIATADVVPNQIVKVGQNAYGTQGHLELTPTMLQEWLKVDPDLLALGPQAVEQVWKDFLEIQEQYTKTSTTLYNNFLDIAERP